MCVTFASIVLWMRSFFQISYDITYIWNLKKWYKWTYLQNRNRVTDFENKCMLQFSSVAQSCPTLCNPMNRSTPGLPVHHQLPEFTQTHVHWVGDAIQPSHPLSSPSPPAPNPSQHQSLFQFVNSLHENGLVGSPFSPRDSQESSPTPQFKSINSSVLSFLHSPTLTSIHDHW